MARPGSKSARRRGTRRPGARLPPFLLLLAAASILSPLPRAPLSSAALVGVRGEEIDPTDEWTELGPNDTIPAGLHVKVDLSTGKKWAKKLDEDEMSDFDRGRAEAEVDADGTAEVAAGGGTSRGVAITSSSSSSSSDSGGESRGGVEGEAEAAGGGEYDYLAMHRTLSNLPPDEMAQYGGLPALPAGLGTPKVSPEQRAVFESKMRDIWTQRQALLREVQENYVADVAKVIAGRIRVIAEYIEDPAGKRAEMMEARAKGGGEGADVGADWEGDEGPAIVTNVVEALEDLEYQLSDVDVARDFHTMGGWTLAVSLLSDAVHCPPPLPMPARSPADDEGAAASTNETAAAAEREAIRRECLEELAESSASAAAAAGTRSLVDKIQTRAAWAVGTAVKNHGEFAGWALEDVSGLVLPPSRSEGGSSTQKGPVTAVSLLASDYLSSSSAARSPSRRQKGLYALGALLRGNPAAQAAFLTTEGPRALADVLVGALEAGDVRFASRVLALGNDLLTEAAEAEGEAGEDEADADETKENGEERGLLEAALTSAPWCDAAIRLASPSSSSPGGGPAVPVPVNVREKALEALAVLAGRCGYGTAERAAVVRCRAEWLGSGKSDDQHLDPAYRNDLVALADAALGAIDAAAGGDGAGAEAER